MQRSHYIAAVVVVGVLVALVVARFAGDDLAPATSEQAGTAIGGARASSDIGGDAAGSERAEGGAGDGEQAGPAPAPVVADPPPVLDPKPALTDLDGWLHTDATSLDDFAGQVRVVEFWTFGCFNCKNRLPHTQELYAEFQPKGLEIIAVHAPEFEYERDPAAVAEASERLGVVWPVALDTRKTNFRAWQGSRRFWPRVYVLDQNGDLRYDHIGEGDYDGLEATVAYLIEHGP